MEEKATYLESHCQLTLVWKFMAQSFIYHNTLEDTHKMVLDAIISLCQEILDLGIIFSVVTTAAKELAEHEVPDDPPHEGFHSSQ